MLKSLTPIILIILLPAWFLTGCVRLALWSSPSLIPNLTQAVFEECDPDLARQSLPADLKLMEGLLKSDPENNQLLTALCMGFTGYAMLFVEEENPERASQFYLRARDYGLKALGLLNKKIILSRLMTVQEKDIEALFWTTMSWNAWINLNLDKPAALAQLTIAQAFLERVLDMKPDFFHGAAYVLMGSILAARPALLGGDEARARECFEKAIDLSHGTFFLAHFYFARYYAVRVQDRGLFFKLIKDVENTSPDELKEACLINAVMQQKTKRLKEMVDELFF